MRLTLDKGTLFLNMNGKPKRIIHLTKTLRGKWKRKKKKQRTDYYFLKLIFHGISWEMEIIKASP